MFWKAAEHVGNFIFGPVGGGGDTWVYKVAMNSFKGKEACPSSSQCLICMHEEL